MSPTERHPAETLVETRPAARGIRSASVSCASTAGRTPVLARIGVQPVALEIGIVALGVVLLGVLLPAAHAALELVVAASLGSFAHGWLFGAPPVRSPLLGPLMILGTVSFVAYLGVAFRHALPGTCRPWVFGVFLAANLVFYAHLRLAVVRFGHLHDLAGQTDRRVTPRSVARADDPLRSVVGPPRLGLEGAA